MWIDFETFLVFEIHVGSFKRPLESFTTFQNIYVLFQFSTFFSCFQRNPLGWSTNRMLIYTCLPSFCLVVLIKIVHAEGIHTSLINWIIFITVANLYCSLFCTNFIISLFFHLTTSLSSSTFPFLNLLIPSFIILFEESSNRTCATNMAFLRILMQFVSLIHLFLRSLWLLIGLGIRRLTIISFVCFRGRCWWQIYSSIWNVINGSLLMI